MTANERSILGAIMAERVALVLLLVWLGWLPLPFGSVTEVSQPALVLFPLFICMLAGAARLFQRRVIVIPRSFSVWVWGGTMFACLVALQVAPLGSGVVSALSPMSHRLWTEARPLYSMAMDLRRAALPHPEVLSVAPAITTLHLFRVISYLAAFVASALLITTYLRRCLMASILGIAALFEVGYGVRELTLRHFEIWGWKNELILDRVTGTYVNPNHFAHYLAIVLPLGLFLISAAWMQANPRRSWALATIPRMIERQLLLSTLGAVVVVGCLTGILVAQSRGALLALVAGAGCVGAALLYRNRKAIARRSVVRALSYTAGPLLVLAILIGLLGTERTIARFRPGAGETLTAVGRTTGIALAFQVWSDFPIMGSGLGTFEEIVLTRQPGDLRKIYNHAHCDYVEILATTGIGFLIAVVTLSGAFMALWKEMLGSRSASRKHFLFLLAVFTALTIAAIHALFDFNFFIPANAATLAVIAGAGSAVRDELTLRPRRRRSMPGLGAGSELNTGDLDPAL